MVSGNSFNEHSMCLVSLYFSLFSFFLFQFPIYIFPLIWGSLEPCRYYLDQRSVPCPRGGKRSEWFCKEIPNFTKWHSCVEYEPTSESRPNWWDFTEGHWLWGTPGTPGATVSTSIGSTSCCCRELVMVGYLTRLVMSEYHSNTMKPYMNYHPKKMEDSYQLGWLSSTDSYSKKRRKERKRGKERKENRETKSRRKTKKKRKDC